MKTYNRCRPNLELSIIKSEMLTIRTDVAMTILAMLTLMLLASPFCL
jgi:hypothetical protein